MQYPVGDRFGVSSWSYSGDLVILLQIGSLGGLFQLLVTSYPSRPISRYCWLYSMNQTVELFGFKPIRRLFSSSNRATWVFYFKGKKTGLLSPSCNLPLFRAELMIESDSLNLDSASLLLVSKERLGYLTSIIRSR